MKKILIGIWLIFLLSAILFLFWHEDWKYNLPTPVPATNKQTKAGDNMHLTNIIKFDNSKPVFIHFFNPECACSRFNIPHFKWLVNTYRDKVNFNIVVLHSSAKYSSADILDNFDLEDIPVYFNKAIADSCGVYSTPQAVITDNKYNLFYRGNYNRSRYCISKSTNYAQQALDSLLESRPHLITAELALTSYGCSIPTCTK